MITIIGLVTASCPQIRLQAVHKKQLHIDFIKQLHIDFINSLRKNPAFGILIWTAYKSENNNYTIEEKEE